MKLALIVIINLISNIIYWQEFSRAAHKSNNSSALTVILQLFAGITILTFIPFEVMKFSLDWRIWSLFILASIFYATNDRIMTIVFKNLQTVEVSLLKQTYLIFIIIIGLVIFKEKFYFSKIIGSILIIISNILLLYNKNIKLEKKKYVLLGVLAGLSMAIALAIDIDISNNYNLAIYSALSLIIPSGLISFVDRKNVKINTIKEELENNKTHILIAAIALGVQIFSMLKAYQLGDVLTVAPLLALSIFANVIFELIFLKKRDKIWNKITSSILIIIAIFLINVV